MKWEGNEESENVEDRRTLGKKGLAIGGGAALLVMLVGLLLGVDPQKLNQFLGNRPSDPNAPQQQGEERQPTAEEQRTRKFASTILRFTEVVWDEQFSKAGKRYEPPHMVLFSREVETGCGNAPSA